MKNELIKKAFRLGNSAGVILPIEWRDKSVFVKLIDKSISQDVIEILEENDWLKGTIAIFLAGSYARGEETEESDIDILVVTDNIDKQVKIGKYELFLISKSKFENSIIKSLYLSSLVNEARVILNDDFLKRYKDKIKGILIKKSIEDIKSVTRINEKVIEIDAETGQKVDDGTLYSLVLRLRELYLIECLKKSTNPSKKEFLDLIKRVASEESYNAYLRIKNNLKPKKLIAVEEARALISEIKKRIFQYDKKR